MLKWCYNYTLVQNSVTCQLNDPNTQWINEIELDNDDRVTKIRQSPRARFVELWLRKHRDEKSHLRSLKYWQKEYVPFKHGSGQNTEVSGRCKYSHSHALCAVLFLNSNNLRGPSLTPLFIILHQGMNRNNTLLSSRRAKPFNQQ